MRPEDIEDVSERYVHMFIEERDSDVVKRVRMRTNETPFFLVSLIEHKSQVDYNVVMQILRYMVFIWEDYEKEMERQRPGISKTKDFKYPPVLPILFYDGKDNWTTTTKLHDRILLSEVLGAYLPDYQCILMQLRDYSNAELMKRKDELSVVMMVAKLQKITDFARIGKEVSSEYLQEIFSDSPEYLLDIVEQVTRALLMEIHVPEEEIEEFSGQIKERRMGRLFANFEPYDVQATRREAREEGREEGRKEELERGIEKLVKTVKNLNESETVAVTQLMEQYGLAEAEASEKAKQYW